MRKKFLVLLILVFVPLTILCSCSTKKHTEPEESDEPDAAEQLPDLIFPEDQFFIHLYGSAKENAAEHPEEDADQKIVVRYFYRGTRPEIAVTGFDNQRAEEAFINAGQKSLNGGIYRGFFYEELELFFDYSRLEYGETVSIRSMTLSVDGKEQTVDVSGRLLLTRSDRAQEEAEQNPLIAQAVRSRPEINQCARTGLQFFTSCELVFVAETDVVVDRLEIGDWYKRDHSNVQVVEYSYETGYEDRIYTEKGSMEEAFPLSLSEGQELHVVQRLLPEAGTPFSNYVTEARLYYHSERFGDQVLHEPMDMKIALPYSTEDEAAVWLDAYLAPQRKDDKRCIFLNDFVYQDLVLGDDENGVGIGICFLYRGPLPYVCFDGTNLGTAHPGDTIRLDKLGNIKEVNGYHMAKMYIRIDQVFENLNFGTTAEIEEIFLSVNGQDKVLDMKGHLFYSRLSEGELPQGRHTGFSFMGTGEKLTQEIPITRVRGNEGRLSVIKRLAIYGPLKKENTVIVRSNPEGKNAVTIGTVEELLPLKLEDDALYDVFTDFNYDEIDPFSQVEFDFLLYTENGTGKTSIQQGHLLQDGLSWTEKQDGGVEKYIKAILKKQEAL